MRVFIGVGHGGSDPGAAASGFKEKDINLDIALAVKAELEKYGVAVGMSRVADSDESLTQRIKKANSFRPDLALDIHTNAGGGRGFEALIPTGRYCAQSKKLALLIEQEVVKMGQKSRGLKTRQNKDGSDYFGFLRNVNAPSVILECAFIDSADILLINTKAKREAFGRAYARGVIRYLGK